MVEALFSIENCMLACPTGMLLAASLAMSAGASAMQYIGQQKAAKAKDAYQNHLAKLQNEAGQRQASAAIAQNIQRQEAVARKQFQVSEEAAKMASMTRASGLARGVAGLSMEHLVSTIDSQQAAHAYALDAEQELADQELDRNLDNINLGTQQQMASTLAPVQYPSALAATLKFGAQAAGAAYEYNLEKGDV